MSDAARDLFYRTRKAHGWNAPEWEDLAEETRELYRRQVSRPDELLARIEEWLAELDAGVFTCNVGELFRDCRAALAERIPREPQSRGWIASKGDRVLHFSELDGWQVTQVLGPFDEKPMGSGLNQQAAVHCAGQPLPPTTPSAVPGIPRERDAERLRWIEKNPGLAASIDAAIAGDSHG